MEGLVTAEEQWPGGESLGGLEQGTQIQQLAVLFPPKELIKMWISGAYHQKYWFSKSEVEPRNQHV